ncbi:hypothetical protein SORBI_3002G417201 [Sorghum bicolor]|uniref:Uncharacterized protein n=1 Tax=Sorghum bicolor TaxID=4558 RepID=C5X5L4_SORBI|nr:hypothetical protein SORBI_3002G417201 [Sorghum bicolor]
MSAKKTYVRTYVLRTQHNRYEPESERPASRPPMMMISPRRTDNNKQTNKIITSHSSPPRAGTASPPQQLSAGGFTAGSSSSLQNTTASGPSPFTTSTTDTASAILNTLTFATTTPLSSSSTYTAVALFPSLRTRYPPFLPAASTRATTAATGSPTNTRSFPAPRNSADRSEPGEKLRMSNAVGSLSSSSAFDSPTGPNHASSSSSCSPPPPCIRRPSSSSLAPWRNHGCATMPSASMRADGSGSSTRRSRSRSADLAVHVHEARVVEGEVTRRQHEQHHAARPDVHLRRLVPFPRQDLRGHVRRGAAHRVPEETAASVGGAGHGAEPEVGHHQRAGLVEEEVLGLDVAVVHAARVAVPHGGHQLPEVVPRKVLRHAARRVDKREQLAAGGEVQHEVDLLARREDLVEPHHVAVPQATEDAGLPLDGHGPVTSGGGARVRERLDGHGPAREQVSRQVHLGGRAAAQEVAELVPAKEHGPGSGGGRCDGAGGGRHRGGGVCSAGAVVMAGRARRGNFSCTVPSHWPVIAVVLLGGLAGGQSELGALPPRPCSYLCTRTHAVAGPDFECGRETRCPAAWEYSDSHLGA